MRLDWMGSLGGVVVGAVTPFVNSTRIPALKNVPDADMWFTGLVAAGSLFGASKMRGQSADFVNGLGVGAVSLLTSEVIGKYGVPATASATSANASAQLVQAAPPVSRPTDLYAAFSDVEPLSE